mgnify:CR=1 FL=1
MDMELLAAIGGMAAAAGGVCGAIGKASWDEWRKGQDADASRFPCGRHAEMIRGLADSLRDIRRDVRANLASTRKIELHLAARNEWLAGLDERLREHAASPNAHGKEL